MVKRDRNHASVVIWSYCNEGGCGSDGAPEFRNITELYDGTRPTLGNAYWSAGMDVRYTPRQFIRAVRPPVRPSVCPSIRP